MAEAEFSLVQLRYFTETARVGSMTEAAKRLHVSQPALSSSITQLERDLGLQLFERIPRRGVRLTSPGHDVYRDATELLAQAERMSQRAGDTGRKISGTLRVGVYQMLAPFRAPSLLQGLSRRYPGLTVELVEADHLMLRQLLDEQAIDVALAYDLDQFEGQRVEGLESVPPHMIVSPRHRLAGVTEPVSLSEFADDPLVLLDLPHTAHYYLGLYRSLGIEPNIKLRVQGLETLRGLVGSGAGVAPLNQRVGHRHTYGGWSVTGVELSDVLPGLQLTAVCRPDDESPRTRAFFDVCRRMFTEQSAFASRSVRSRKSAPLP